MASTNQCIASMARLSLSTMTRPSIASAIPKYLAPSINQTRWKTSGTQAMQARAREREKLKKKRKQQRFKEYKYATPSREEQFSLCDAMRYLRAAEVGRPPSSVTYEVSLKIRTIKNSPLLRDRIRLPYPVKNDTKIAVICKPELASDARLGGAVAWGEEELFELIRNNAGKLPFNRLICHADSEAALKKSGLGRILGPKGLMPSLKTNTITKSIRGMMSEMVGAEAYREKIGAIRMPIGNIQFNPRQLAENVKTLIASVKANIELMEDRVKKDLIEVVLTSTNGPGFSLNGNFSSTDEKVTVAHLSTAM
ncbi:50S ribosomal protein L1 [Xylariomycetidae sp. FL2044]|nr:50S ribosomal protein L1 [Xylariomycetidae sp. FL2044]